MKAWGLIAFGLIAGLLVHAVHAQPTTNPSQSAAIVLLKGPIDDFSRRSLERRFAEARASGAHTVILQIDTYGGLVTSALDMSRFIKRQNDLHTIAFVDEKAISAGAMISLACDELVMQNSSVIGDCAPIVFQSDGTLESLPPAERAKQESPILAEFRDSATRNGYDLKVAEAMVAVDRVVHYVQSPEGEKKFVDQDEYTKLKGEGWTPVAGVPDPLDGQADLLTVHADIAQKIGLAKGVYSSPEAFAQARGLNIIDTFSAGVGEEFVEMLGSTAARAVLIVIFIMSLKLALAAPGHGAAEAVALLSGGLLFGVPLLTGYAQWYEVVAIFLGLALLAFEIFVFPGHLISGAIGLLLIIGGLVLTFVGREPGALPGVLPKLSGTWQALQHGILIVTGGLISSLLLSIWLQRYLPKIPYFNRLVITTTSGGSSVGTSAAPASEVSWPEIGAVGTAVTDLRPGGSASFTDQQVGDSRIASVVSDTGFVPANTNVVVREARRGYVVVRPLA
jgi:membrane-bound serine protease (ClpP class)